MKGLLAKENRDDPMLGIGLMLLAYATFSCIDVSAKYLGSLALPALQLTFMRYFGHFVVSTGIIAKDGIHWSRFDADHKGLVIFRGFLLVGSTVFNFIALRYLPLTLTSTILFSAPIIICLLSWPLLGEKVGVWRWSAILLGFAGILVAIRPFSIEFHWATLLSIAGAFCFALYSILTRKLAGKVATDTMQLYSGFIGVAIVLPFAILEWQNPATAFDWMVMFALGILGWVGHQMLTQAHAYAPSNLLMPYGYSFILYMTLWSWLVFDQAPDTYMILGAIIIIIAGLIIWLRERHLHKRPIVKLP